MPADAAGEQRQPHTAADRHPDRHAIAPAGRTACRAETAQRFAPDGMDPAEFEKDALTTVIRMLALGFLTLPGEERLP